MTHSHPRRLGILAFWLLASLSAAAQEQVPGLTIRYHFQHFGRGQGLSQGSVTALLRDHRGFLWVGTEEGLNRFDGYTFKVYNSSVTETDGLSHGNITALYQDPDHNIWIGTRGGLNRMDARTGAFTRMLSDPDDPTRINNEYIQCMRQDPRGFLWIGTRGHGLNRLNPATGEVQRFYWDDEVRRHVICLLPAQPSGAHMWVGTSGGLFNLDTATGKMTQVRATEEAGGDLGAPYVHALHEHPKGTLWAATETGLLRLDYQEHRFKHYQHDDADPTSIAVNQAMDVCADSRDPSLLWVATVRGLNLLNLQTGSFRLFRYDPSDAHGLADDIVYRLLRDDMGSLWVGTYGKGLNLMRPEVLRFGHTVFSVPADATVKPLKVMSFLRDPDGVLWVGTLDGGLVRAAADGRLEVFYKEFGSTSIFALYGDDTSLWVGSQNGFALFDRDTRKVTARYTASAEPDGLHSHWVTAFQPDPREPDVMWVGTYDGLHRMDANGKFQRFANDPGDPASLADNWVADMAVIPGKPNELWVAGMDGGLNRMNLVDGKVRRYLAHNGEATGPAGDSILCVQNDPRDRNTLWLGTRSGLSRMDVSSEQFRNYFLKDGMPNELIYGVLVDHFGHVWMSTNLGVSRFDPVKETFRNYTELDGLQSDEYNLGAYYKDAAGVLYFGGVNGFNMFNPEHIVDNTQRPRPVLTELLLANKPVDVRPRDPRSPLDLPIHLTPSFELQPSQNMFSLRFAALHYANPSRNRYAYQLEGFDNRWLDVDAQTRMATYTNLPSGTFTFRLKAANKDGYWGEEEARVVIKVLPPPWRTWWAYTLYGLALTGIVVYYIRMQNLRLAAEREASQREREVSRRLRQIDRLKDEFLANTSHELRTPLNGIIGLAESLITGVTGPITETTRENLAMIISSARRLNNLVNDILDFSKLKNKTLEIHQDAVNVAATAEDVLVLTRPLAAQAGLALINDIPPDLPPAFADADRLEQILYNLVGNAVKFTDAGHVRLFAEVRDGLLHISVEDTGIGIPADKHADIFKSFEQVDGSAERAHGGTGLGLAITRKVVELHGGTISVADRPEGGSCFTFTMPLADAAWRDAGPAAPRRTAPLMPRVVEAPADDDDSAAPMVWADGAEAFTLLVVDDEPVNRRVIVNYLRDVPCTVLEAASGAEALHLLETQQVGLMLLDIMMPRMSGIEVCRTVRRTQGLMHLPIIFLTAKNQMEDLREGFEAGANDYMIKPVQRGELLARLGTHLQLLTASRDLESRVAERTAELTLRNEEIVRAQKHLIMQEKLAFLGNLSTGMAHEIRNPLNIVKNLTEVCEELAREVLGEVDAADGPVAADVVVPPLTDLVTNTEVMSAHCDRMERIISQLASFARERKNEFREVMVNTFCETYFNMAARGYDPREGADAITYSFKADSRLGTAWMMPGELSRALINVINNACDAVLDRAAREGEGYAPRVSCSTALTGDGLEIRVRDNGGGIAPEHRDSVFRPFFTTRLRDRHIGLGLSIAEDIVSGGHEGRIELRTDPGGDTVVVLHLPLGPGGPGEPRLSETATPLPN